MKQYAFLIFLGIILSVHFLVNYYIYVRGSQGLEAMPQLKMVFKWSMLVLFLSYPLGRFLEKVWLSPVSDAAHWIGALWFAGMLYGFLFVVLVDLVRLADMAFHFLPQPGHPAYLKLKLNTTLIVAITLLLVVIAGFYNAWHPKTSIINLTIHKQAGSLKKLRIVAASDVHMGTIIAQRKTAKLVDSINALNPDIILFAGDVVDEDVQPVIRQNLGKSLLKLDAPMGVFAVTGNHEFIGGVDRTAEYLTSHGLVLLRDTSVLIGDAFYVVGREDRDKERFTQQARKNVDVLLGELDKSKPIIMLDHQPYHLDVPMKGGVDLQISGHTHHGQLWPFNFITKKIFEVSRGYKQKGNSHFYVSTGFGTWGPPVRIGNRPEIMVFDIEFVGEKL